MPLTSKTFSQLIDFTRTSAATYVDQLGRIVPTPVSPNLLTFTQELDNAAWTKTNATVVTNAGLAPDGTMTADKLVESATTGAFSASQAPTMAASTMHTFSCSMRAAERSFGVMNIYTGTASCWTWFNLSNGTVATLGSGATASIEPMGGGWYRCSLSIQTASSGTPNIAVWPAATNGVLSYAGTAGSGIFIWGAQLEQTPDANLTLGSELTTNGTLDTDTAWAKGTGWTISSGAAQANVGAFQVIDQTITITTGKVYRVSFDVTAYSSGNVRASLIGGTAVIGAVRASTGQYVAYLAAVSGNNKIAIGSDGSGFIGTIDNISVREVTAASPSTYTRNFGGRFPPRFDYDPVTLAPRGLLIEEQRTNLVTRSEEFDNAAWQKTGVTVTANATTSPDGTVDADKLVEDSTSAAHQTFNGPISISAGSTYTYTVYAKAAERSWFAISAWDTSERFTFFNLATGVVGTNAVGNTATITPVGNGWYRCTVTRTVSAASTYGQFFVSTADNVVSYTGTAGSGVFIWGAQLEAGAFATSYIPTVASQVTRTADSAAITGANFSPWYNQSEGTFVAEATFFGLNKGLSDGLLAASIGTSAENTALFRTGAANNIAGIMRDGSSDQAVYTVAMAGQPVKVALAYATNNTGYALNGTAQATDTACTVPTVDRLLIGAVYAAGDFPTNGHIRSIRYYPTRLTNAQLQALTA
jgi:hypothetical protein